MTVKSGQKEYALYKGDELLCIGTKAEIAEHQGISMSCVNFYMTPGYKKRFDTKEQYGKRLILVSLDEEETA